MDFQFSLILSLLKDMLPTFSYTKIRASYPAPAYRAVYEQVLGCPAEFDCGANEFHFDAMHLNQLPSAIRREYWQPKRAFR